MAEAERVVVEIEARTGALLTAVNNAGKATDAAMTQVERAASRAEGALQTAATGMGQAVDRAAAKIEGSSARAANATRNLGRQISDIGVGLSSGQSPFLIIAQQAPQVADALADTGGKAARLATFFAGPWGAALLAAGSALGVLVGKALESGESIESLVERLRLNAERANQSATANDRFGRTLEGVEQAAEAAEKAVAALNGRNKTQAQTALQAADTALQNVETLRLETQAAIELAKALYEAQRARASGPGERGDLASLGLSTSFNRIGEAEARLGRLDNVLERIRNSRGVLNSFVELERANVSVQDQINQKYDTRLEAARRLRAENQLNAQQLREQVKAINAARDAELNRARQTSGARRRSGQGAGETASLLFPVEGGRISSGVGSRRAPTAGASTNHAGIDVAVPIGTNVRAGASGVVVYAGRLGGYGNAVVVDYGAGTIAKYGHLSNLLTKSGDRVSAGDVIAQSGNTGRSTGPHLHYEVRTNGRVVDPRGRVRVGNQDLAVARDYAQAQREADRTQAGLERGVFNADDLERALADRLRMLSSADVANILGREGVDWRGPSADVEEYDRNKVVAGQMTEEVRRQQRDKQEQDIRTLADLYQDLFTGGVSSIWQTFEREGLRAIALVLAQLTIGKSLGDAVGTAVGGSFGGLFGGLPGFAQGGSFTIGGRGGLDRNVLSVNGSPVARVNQGERLDIVPSNVLAKSNSGPRHFHIAVDARNSVTPASFARELSSEILAQADAMDRGRQGETLRAAPAVVQRAQRYGGA